MKNKMLYKIIVTLIVTGTLIGTSHAGVAGSDETSTSKAAKTPTMTTEEKAADAAQNIVLAGTINEDSMLVDDQGKAFNLSQTEQGNAIRSLIGKKVEIKGTVLEEKGQQVVEVHEYKIME